VSPAMLDELYRGAPGHASGAIAAAPRDAHA